MASLNIAGLNINYLFPRLAKRKALCAISEKTVTRAARSALRHLGYPNIQVCCAATLNNVGGVFSWSGQCFVNGQQHSYTVQ